MSKAMFYVPVGKPRQSRVWTLLYDRTGNVPVRVTPKHAREVGQAIIPDNIGAGQRFDDPAAWEASAAAVVLVDDEGRARE